MVTRLACTMMGGTDLMRSWSRRVRPLSNVGSNPVRSRSIEGILAVQNFIRRLRDNCEASLHCQCKVCFQNDRRNVALVAFQEWNEIIIEYSTTANHSSIMLVRYTLVQTLLKSD